MTFIWFDQICTTLQQLFFRTIGPVKNVLNYHTQKKMSGNKYIASFIGT